jgi:phosphoserine phosphatase
LTSILANWCHCFRYWTSWYDTLSLGILFEIQSGSTSGPVLKDLLFKAYELGIQVKFIPISIADYEIWVKTQHSAILYILGETLTAVQLSAVK